MRAHETFPEVVEQIVSDGVKRKVDPKEIARRIAWAVRGPLQVGLERERLRLLREANWKPVCWLCDHRIFLDYDANDPASLTLDHVIPRAQGGTRSDGNLRLAHGLCNSLRGQNPGAKAQRKLARMKAELAARTALESSRWPLFVIQSRTMITASIGA